MARYIALLRGVNVSGHNPLPMAALRGLLEALPARDVATYLQSGNAVLSSDAADPDALAGAISTRIQSELGLDVTVLVRAAEDFARVAAANPFLADHPDGDGSRLHVTFLTEAPDADRAAQLTSAVDADTPDSFRVSGARGVPVLSQRLRPDQAQQHLLREEAGPARHHPQLADRDRPGRDDPVTEVCATRLGAIVTDGSLRGCDR